MQFASAETVPHQSAGLGFLGVSAGKALGQVGLLLGFIWGEASV